MFGSSKRESFIRDAVSIFKENTLVGLDINQICTNLNNNQIPSNMELLSMRLSELKIRTDNLNPPSQKYSMIPVKISILIMMNSSCLKILSEAIKLKQADNKIEYNQKIADFMKKTGKASSKENELAQLFGELKNKGKW